MNSIQWRISIFIGIFCSILIIGTIIRIALEAEYAPDGETLYQLQQQISEIKKQNMLLKEQLYTDKSLTHIAGEAAKMGFIPAADYIYLWPTH